VKRKWIIILLALPVLLIGLLAGIGFLIPEKHSATCTATIPATPDEVFRLITDFDGGAKWREGLERVERLDGVNGRASWIEHTDYGPIALEVVETDAPKRLVTRVADEDLPFGGTWTYTLEADGDHCRVSITEDGEIKNPVFRTFTLFVFGYHRNLGQYLGDVGRHFGADVDVTES
jgi:uncharacterized protein YndB with AHSA1/START domain